MLRAQSFADRSGSAQAHSRSAEGRRKQKQRAAERRRRKKQRLPSEAHLEAVVQKVVAEREEKLIAQHVNQLVAARVSFILLYFA